MFHVCFHRSKYIYIAYMKLVKMLVIISFECIFKFFNWSRYFQLPSSDEMKMFYTEHDFQVEHKNFEFNLNLHAERIQY